VTEEKRSRLRVVIADDERPARSFLAALLRSCEDVSLVAEVESGREAVAVIESEKPDLALLDLEMPELDGLGVVRALNPRRAPLIAFVTAYDEYAMRAFEVHAVDYLLKPVEKARLRATLNRAHERIEHADIVSEQATRIGMAAEMFESGGKRYLERIPVRRREEIAILRVEDVAFVVAEGELLHLTTTQGQRHTISYRLKDLEARLDPARFLRLGRGTLVNIDRIARVQLTPGGTNTAVLCSGERLPLSRQQSRLFRDRYLRL
jgi:two-component system LytT family response regulator